MIQENSMAKVYPEWDEIKHDIDKHDLLIIVEMGLELGIDKAIEDYIKDNYEPVIIREGDQMRINAFFDAIKDLIA